MTKYSFSFSLPLCNRVPVYLVCTVLEQKRERERTGSLMSLHWYKVAQLQWRSRRFLRQKENLVCVQGCTRVALKDAAKGGRARMEREREKRSEEKCKCKEKERMRKIKLKNATRTLLHGNAVRERENSSDCASESVAEFRIDEGIKFALCHWFTLPSSSRSLPCLFGFSFCFLSLSLSHSLSLSTLLDCILQLN